MLQCQALIEEMLVSNSTDLQQRGYELQEITGLEAHALVNILPMDSTCEEIEVTLTVRIKNFNSFSVILVGPCLCILAPWRAHPIVFFFFC